LVLLYEIYYETRSNERQKDEELLASKELCFKLVQLEE